METTIHHRADAPAAAVRPASKLGGSRDADTGGRGLTLDQSTALKGVAIVLMVAHHLFTFPDKIKPSAWHPMFAWLPLGKDAHSLEAMIGGWGKICVPVFLFLSGLGLAHHMRGELGGRYWYVLRKAGRVLKAYWLCFAIFVPVAYWMAPLIPPPNGWRYGAVDVGTFLDNLLLGDFRYNQEWWFAKTYLEMLLVAPLLLTAVERWPRWTVLGSLALLAFIVSPKGDLLVKADQFLTWRRHEPPGRLDLGQFALWQAAYCLGMVCCRYGVIEKLRAEIPAQRVLPVALVAMACSPLAWPGSSSTFLAYPLATALFILGGNEILRRLRLQGAFRVLGKHSLYIWLTHSFFCYYLFQPLALKPRLSIAILAWVVLLSLGASLVLRCLERQVVDRVGRMIWNSTGAAAPAHARAIDRSHE